MNLKERCEKLYRELSGLRSLHWMYPIEEFAREIRNEALEEAADAVWPGPRGDIASRTIHALKDADILAAGQKGDT